VKVPEKCTPLRLAVECLVVSTAKCERSFNVVNDIASDNRWSLGVKRISVMTLAKWLGPKDTTVFNPKSEIRKWLASGRRSADETASRKRVTTKLHLVTTANYVTCWHVIKVIKYAVGYI